MKKMLMAAGMAAALATPAWAFDGWHFESATVIPGGASGWDYIAFEATTKRLFLGHRKEGLQVYDPATRKLVATVENTAARSSNGATLMPEFDLGISNNEDGSITPFKISTLASQAPIKLGEELDTSHYDPATKRIVVNMGNDSTGTDLIVLDVPSLAIAGKIRVAAKKSEGAVADGAGGFFLAAQDLNKILVLDTKAMKVSAEWATPGCGKPTATDIDAVHHRLFVSCRGDAANKPSFIVMNSQSGAVMFTAEIGGGSDGVVYDAELRRIFSTNGVNANLSVIEQADADTYKLVETLGTRAAVKVLAMDHASKTLYSMTAEGSADAGKKINTAVSPYYANTFYPNTFTVLSYVKK